MEHRHHGAQSSAVAAQTQQHITRDDHQPLSHHDDIPLRSTDSSDSAQLDGGSRLGPQDQTQTQTQTQTEARSQDHAAETSRLPSSAAAPQLPVPLLNKDPPSSVQSSSSSPTPTSISTYTSSTRTTDDELSRPLTDREQNCDRRRPEEIDHPRLPAMSNQFIGKTVSPYLKEHIPGLYAPVAKSEPSTSTSTSTDMVPRTDPNSKYCYRHRPDLKCRRAADETKMVLVQNSLEKLPSADQQAITHVWSLFSAAPARHRDLMLQGIMTQCCFPQLSTVSREVHEQLKIDLLTALPAEIAYKILCYLDTVSLCKAAQVSRQWRQLADDDLVWHRMCEQHIDRKCTKCGWGLPLLERKRLRDWTRQQQLAKSKTGRTTSSLSSPPSIPTPLSLRSPTPPKREFDDEDGEDGKPKRQCLSRIGSGSSEPERKFRPFKDVYRDRFRIGYNWRHGKCTIKILKGHTNGVTCLQLLDSILATGSYDSTIKIWNIETGEEIRTLTGHVRGIRSLQFDDSKLISGSLDKTVKIWNWHTGELLSSLGGHADGVISVHFDGEFLASGSIDTSVKVFNFNTKETFSLRGHSDWVNSVRVDAESRTVLSASDDFKVKLWDLDTKQCIRTYDNHTGHVQQVLPLPPDFEPDDELLQGVPGLVALRETTEAGSPGGGGGGSSNHCSAVETNQAADGSSSPSCPSPSSPSSSFSTTTAFQTPRIAPGLLRHHPDHAHAHASRQQPPADEQQALRRAYGEPFAADPSRPLPSRYMLSGGLDSTVRLMDTATGRCLKTFFGHFEGVWGLAGDTLRAVTAANDGMVKVWEPTSGRCERTFTGHRGPVTCVSLSDSRMASGGEDGEVRIYSFHDGEGLSELGTPS